MENVATVKGPISNIAMAAANQFAGSQENMMRQVTLAPNKQGAPTGKSSAMYIPNKVNPGEYISKI